MITMLILTAIVLVLLTAYAIGNLVAELIEAIFEEGE